MYPPVLSDLINYFRKLPGIGEKSAERMALSLLELNQHDVEEFAKSMVESKSNLHTCSVCGHITDKDVCDICSSERRNKNVICILEDYKSVFAFEKAGNYNGTYHVLNGLISPVDDVNPEDINLASLVSRVESLDKPELIIALKSSVEGEATSMYISKLLKPFKIKISRIAFGIPIGSDLEFADEITLAKAIEGRRIINNN